MCGIVCLELTVLLAAVPGHGADKSALGSQTPKATLIQPRPARAGSQVALMAARNGRGSLNVGASEQASRTSETWLARSVEPERVELTLGTSGASITLEMDEDGRYSVASSMGVASFVSAPDGTPVRVTARNGNSYALAKDASGEWMATFVPPSPVSVSLGTSGTSVEIQRAEDGSYSVGGELLAEGATAVASNGAVYALTRNEEGRWTAMFVPLKTTVELGSSSESVIIETAEGGGYLIAGQALVDGATVAAANGNKYTLVLDEAGNWTAMFELPDPVSVTLGASGSSVEIQRAEDGSYSIGGNPLTEGYTHMAANGERYALSMNAEGDWIATHKGLEAIVVLGASGGRMTLVRAEDGTYYRDGAVFESGTVVTLANSVQYTVALGSDGAWMASFVPREDSIALGTNGRLTLTQAENGTWSTGDMRVDNGGTVKTDNGVTYRLAFVNGFWSATFEPEQKEIEGTGLIAMSREDRRGYWVETSTLPESGVGDVTVGGATYHVWMDGGQLRGIRFDKAPHGTDAADANFQVGLASGVAELSADDEGTVANETGTALKVGGSEFPLAELLRSGAVRVSGENLVGMARAEVASARAGLEALIQALDDDTALLTELLNGRWDRAQSAIDGIFGSDNVNLRREHDSDAVAAAFDALIAALSSEAVFKAATAGKGGGVFEGAGLSATEAARTFRAVQSQAMAVLGVLGETRYGALWSKSRESGNAVDDVGFDDEDAELGAFAYSTTASPAWTRLVATTGTARYEGATLAVSGDGTFYEGDIELAVYFGTRKLNAVISNLTDAQGKPWSYQYGNVGSIILPDAQLKSNADWSFQVRSTDRARISYPGGFVRPTTVQSTFDGHLVGTGPNAGSQAVGVWSVGDQSSQAGYLAGGFGAQRVGDREDPKPPTDQGAGTGTTVVREGTEILNGILTLRGTRYGPNLGTPGIPDDEIQLLDGGSRIEEVHQVGLEDLFLRQGAERLYSSMKQVDLAREQIGGLREQLTAWIGIDEVTEFGNRQRIWDSIYRVIQSRLFGIELSSTYPATGGRARDSAALETIDEMLEALASRDAFAGALESGGVFTDADGNAFRGTAVDDIWNRAEARIGLWLDSTDYTRFGAWRKQTSPNASADYVNRVENDENGPNSFAYSPLAQTVYRSDRVANYPGGVTATYTGKTVAVQGPTFYTGSVEVVAEWHLAWQGAGNRQAGTLAAVLSDLRTDQGDPLTFTVTDSGASREQAVKSLILSQAAIRIDSAGRVYFSGDGSSAARLRFVDVADSDVGVDSATIDGKFVGQGVDGPLAVIGIWTARDDGDTMLGTGHTVYGAFGAELGP